MEVESKVIESHTEESYQVTTRVEKIARGLANVKQHKRIDHAKGVHESDNHVTLKKETWEAIGKFMGWLK